MTTTRMAIIRIITPTITSNPIQNKNKIEGKELKQFFMTTGIKTTKVATRIYLLLSFIFRLI